MAATHRLWSLWGETLPVWLLQMAQLKEKIIGVEAANRTSPSKAYLTAAAGVSGAAGQHRTLFHSDTDDAKLDSDLESGTIPAL